MVKYESKVVRLSAETCKLIEEYKSNLVTNIYRSSIRFYIEEMNYDQIIKAVFSEILRN